MCNSSTIQLFSVFSVADDMKVAEERMGQKTKSWLVIPGMEKQWLWKESRNNSGVWQGDHWAELLASLLAKQLSLRSPEVRLAKDADKLGCIVEHFSEINPNSDVVTHGNVFLWGYDPDVHPEKAKRGQNPGHTLGRIISALGKYEIEPKPLIEYFIFDVWIGNVDRHHQNWAIINRARIAPSYDHGSSLGREIWPSKAQEYLKNQDLLTNYIQKSQGEVSTESGSRNLWDLWIEIKRDHGNMAMDLLGSIMAIDLRKFEELISQIPVDMMPEENKKLVLKILFERREKMRK